MLLPSLRLLVLPKPSPRNGVLSVFVPTPSPSVLFTLGLLPRTLSGDVADSSNRLTQAKEEGATIDIDGKKVALGIPGTGSGANQPGPKSYPLIPLARGASPDEAANGMLLYVACLSWMTDFVF